MTPEKRIDASLMWLAGVGVAEIARRLNESPYIINQFLKAEGLKQ